MKKVVLILIVLFSSLGIYAQNDAILTQQWLSRINCNPAATGNTDDVNIFLLHRVQWSGINEAPQTSLLNATNYFKSINSGVGLSLSYDKEGAFFTNYNAKAAYAYHLQLSDAALLSLGLGLNLQNRSINFDKLYLATQDPKYQGRGKESKTGIDFDFGLEFNTSRFTLGAALNRIGKTDVEKLNQFKNGQQIYAYARYRISAFEGLDLAPTASYVYANHLDVWEVGLTGFIANQVWLGAAYRYEVALAFSAGFEFNMFRVGYAYDHYINQSTDLGGIHEIMLSVKIPHKK
jgi:type IX secretion system PorP/SprF family membrane protein